MLSRLSPPVLGLFVSMVVAALSQAQAASSLIPSALPVQVQLAMLEDDRNLLSIEDIRNPANTRNFKPLTNPFIHRGFDARPLWLRITLNNPQPTPESVVLELNCASLGHIFWYEQQQANDYRLHLAGSQTNQVQGTLPGTSYLFQIHLPPQHRTVDYVRLSSDFPLNLTVRVLPLYEAGLNQARQNALLGCGYGLLFSVLLYHLFALFRTHQIKHLHYTVFTIAMCLYLGAYEGFIGLYYWPIPRLQNLTESAGLLLVLITISLFSQSCLKLGRKLRWAHHLLTLQIVIFSLLLLAVPLLSLSAVAHYSYAAALCGTLLILAIALLSAFYRQPVARTFLLTGSASFLAMLLNLLQTWGHFSFLLPLGHILLIAMLLQSITIIILVGITASQLQEKVNQLLLKNKEAERAIQLRNRILMQISHEMRTPIGSILGMAELMINSSLSPRQHDFATTILLSTQSMLRTLKDLVDFAQHNNQPHSIIAEPFELDELLLECLSIFREHAEEKHLELVGSRDPEMANKVIGDPHRLRQLISTLLRNSVRYTHRGEISLTLMPAATPDTLRCEVCDTGIGIPADTLRTLFHDHKENPEDTANEVSRDEFQENHPGLNLCYQWILQMGGRMGAESRERHGSCLWFEVPCKIQTFTPPSPLPYEHLLTGLRLLVVDDNQTAAKVIAQQAKSWGVKVTVCDNAVEALAQTHNAINIGSPFEVIVLDQNMPGMNGIQLAARIKEDALITTDILMIMLTGTRMAPTQTMARNVGIRRILTKPVTSRELKIALTQELGIIKGLQHPKNISATQADELEKLQRMRVLIAEDNLLSQKVVRGMLQKLGVSCTVVANGQEAFEEVSRHRYDLVLMDCDMPLMDGYRATQAIRHFEKQNNRPRLPILALTAHMVETYEVRSMEVGMNEHLNKPLELSQLKEAILRWS